MTCEIVATTETQLKELNDRIHDRWFSVDDIEYRSATGELLMLFSDDDTLDRRSLCSVKGTEGARALVIRHVRSYEFEDTQRIVWYDFNRVRYKPCAGVLEVLTNIPLLVRVRISALEVRVVPYRKRGGPGTTECNK